MERLLYTNVKVKTKLKRPHVFNNPFLCNTDDISTLVYSGYLKAYDPLTNSTILCHIVGGNVTENVIILGHTIDSVTHYVDSTNPSINRSEVETIVIQDTLNRCKNNPYYSDKNSTITEANIRGDEIVNWLNKNRIPAYIEESSKDIVISDSIRLQQPYEHISDYRCPTRIILKRIKTIIDSRR